MACPTSPVWWGPGGPGARDPWCLTRLFQRVSVLRKGCVFVSTPVCRRQTSLRRPFDRVSVGFDLSGSRRPLSSRPQGSGVTPLPPRPPLSYLLPPRVRDTVGPSPRGGPFVVGDGTECVLLKKKEKCSLMLVVLTFVGTMKVWSFLVLKTSCFRRSCLSPGTSDDTTRGRCKDS